MDLYRCPKKTHAHQQQGSEIITTYTSSIDLKCKRGGSVVTLCDRHWHTWKVKLLHLVVHTPLITWFSYSPQCFPSGSTTDMFGPVRFIRDRDDGRCHLPINVPSLIWMMMYKGREVTGLETLLMGRQAKSTKSIELCVWVSMFMVRRGQWDVYVMLLCGAHHL